MGAVELAFVAGNHGEGAGQIVLLQEAGFELQEAFETPAGGGHGFHQIALGLIGGLEAMEVGGDVAIKSFGVLAGDQHGRGAETVAEGVLGGLGFSFRGDRSVGLCAVGAGGFGLRWSGHVSSFLSQLLARGGRRIRGAEGKVVGNGLERLLDSR